MVHSWNLWYTLLQIEWHRILRIFVNPVQCTLILPIGFTISSTGWRRPIGCLIFRSQCPQKSPIISGSFAERDTNLRHPMGLRHPVSKGIRKGNFTTNLSANGRMRQIQNTTSCHHFDTINSNLNWIRIAPGGTGSSVSVKEPLIMGLFCGRCDRYRRRQAVIILIRQIQTSIEFVLRQGAQY